ncbi:hypothetical protein [Chromobacterium sp. IIBBL 290-4]|uniref:hypothetical protein n=1 Tax=Chromobacterium sp. IIBBL 290-4 TaxID=2953890 RepID=UPI0020B75C9D|nr:hypothetical protein [Chromobacterium sp. IIBBL 290-4]UTH72863.1 hypothetical protein NKT35_15115 [Chromobacterium sp. IIBBL 290-4]
MKRIYCLLLLAPLWAGAAPQASAPHGRQQGEARFAEMKAKLLQLHNQHIQILQNSISCIQGAQNPQALKSCMETQRQQMEALRPGH